MMTRESRKRLVAWLGMIAMLLVTCVPLASQLIAASHGATPSMMYCGMKVGDPAMSSVVQSDTHGTDDKSSQHKAASGQTDVCGYCSFFDHYTSLPTSVVTAPQLVRLLIALTITALAIHGSRTARYPSRRPRAPPAVL
ncbi:putative membrane protein [Herbaspirillum sp. Sphag1AN]|uniref:DUF2946 domain-containing protein n=1 Tax=unclassified Herbaspirillum TaxID=2624150 RepID=UPI00162073DC|nr:MULTISPECIES: DUF2946 domain-containing protein [unclassified Herbaspirillum]MBB3214361.1 putative membrane protein [Herbaspirillum sp. Sphag1AN]MBB3247413.1 putative membrane protein [Herbaspirillum sp. Sphag64]